MSEKILAINNLSVFSTLEGRMLVEDISFSVHRGEPFTLIGETGCGKTLIAKALTGSLPEDLTATGSVEFGGVNLVKLSKKERRKLWGKRLFLLPQEPRLSLNPTMRVIKQVSEVLRYLKGYEPINALKNACSLMSELGLSSSRDIHKYPSMLSGGMNQRILLSIALATPAELIIADEPTKGLDSILKESAVRLLKNILEKGKALVCITHDLEVARILGGNIAVMYGGYIVETGPAEKVLYAPSHPYTQGLINAAPENGLKPIPDHILNSLKTAWNNSCPVQRKSNREHV